MDKKSTSDLVRQWAAELKLPPIPEKTLQITVDFIEGYRVALSAEGLPFEPQIPIFRQFLQFMGEQIRKPYKFEPYHRKVRHPIDYYEFSLGFLRPLIDPGSTVLGLDVLNDIEKRLQQGENAVFLANHQTEADPQAIAILLEKTNPKLAEQIIYVAGERVVTDLLAIPFSLGCDLLCIYSKRYIDYPPEQKTQKLLHNKNTMELMSKLLSEGGKAIYVAPSGGRDRKDAQGNVEPARFDPNSVEMFYLMAKKAKTPTHFYPLALDTYALLPPPETIQIELGETRNAKRAAVHLAFGPALDLEQFDGVPSKEERRSARTDMIWKTVCHYYRRIRK